MCFVNGIMHETEYAIISNVMYDLYNNNNKILAVHPLLSSLVSMLTIGCHQ
jgi:hypothetical protein